MSFVTSRNDPTLAAFPITPDDSHDLPHGMCDSIYVGTGGNLTVVVGGQTVTYKNLPTPCVVNVRATAVKTATTALDMLAQYAEQG